jgi:hypothetical protein
MANVSIVEALADSLEAMRQGRDIEACLERYPEYRSELKALLQVASLIRPLPENVAPSPDFREATRSRITDADGMPDSYHLGEDAQDIP